jgi:lysophospholipase L1-like esterase
LIPLSLIDGGSCRWLGTEHVVVPRAIIPRVRETRAKKPPDYLHLTARGNRLWADAMEPTLWRLLDEPKKKG